MTVIDHSDGREGRQRGDEGPGPTSGGDPVAVRLRRRRWAVVALAVLLLAAVLRAACYLTVLQAPAAAGWGHMGVTVAAEGAAPDSGAVDPWAPHPWGPHPWRFLRLRRPAVPHPHPMAPVPPAPMRATLVSQGPGQAQPEPGPSER